MTDVETEQDLYQLYPDLKRLARVLRRSQGEFSLFFAECNLPVLREQLAFELTKSIQPKPIEVDLSGLSSDSETIDEAIARKLEDSPKGAAVFLFGLEELLPTLSSDKLRATVQQLNWRRSSLSRLQLPLVIWLPSYALDLLAEKTPDFYDWYSGIYHFSVMSDVRDYSERLAFQEMISETGVHAADHMSLGEKKRWLGTLTALLQEHCSKDHQRAVLLHNAAYLFRSLGDHETALDYLHQSLKINQDVGDQLGVSVTLNNISQIYNAHGDYERALSYLEQSLSISEENDDQSGVAGTLNNISYIYRIRGDYGIALTYQQKSLKIYQELGDKQGVSTNLNNLSQVLIEQGNEKLALSYLEKALSISEEIGDKAGVGTASNNISQIYKARGDYEIALVYLQQSLDISKLLGNKLGAGVALNNIAQIHRALGDNEMALNYQKQSLSVSQAVGDKLGESITLFNIGHTYVQMGEKQSAVKYWVDAYAIAKSIGGLEVLEALKELADLLGLEGGLSAWDKPPTL